MPLRVYEIHQSLNDKVLSGDLMSLCRVQKVGNKHE